MNNLPSNETFTATLVQPRTVAMLIMCRKYIFSEFHIKLNLHQPDILERIQEYAKDTKNPNLKRLVYELEKALVLH